MPFNNWLNATARNEQLQLFSQVSSSGSSVREEANGGFISSRATFSSAGFYRSASKTNTFGQTSDNTPKDTVDISEIALKYSASGKMSKQSAADKSSQTSFEAEFALYQKYLDKLSKSGSVENSVFRIDNQMTPNRPLYIFNQLQSSSILAQQQNAEYSKYENTLSSLKELDPELYDKAIGLLASIGVEDRERMLESLNKIDEFVNSIHQTNSYVDNGLLRKYEEDYTLRISRAYDALNNELDDLEQIIDAQLSDSSARSVVSPDRDPNQSGSPQTSVSTPSQSQRSDSSFSMSAELNMQASFAVNNGRQLSLNTNRTQIVLNLVAGNYTFCDPLVLDIDGDGIDMKSSKDGVTFDIDGDGEQEQTGFVQGDDALLYLDKNGNGTADNGKELFGDQNGAANGFAELAKYDQNQDGKIDELDEIYSQLRIWQDSNGDGINQLLESQTLSAAGIATIFLDYFNSMTEDKSGNMIAQEGSFQRTDGSTSRAIDALFRAG